jgi:hypothetical protein
MSEYDFCGNCGDFTDLSTHKCPPEWEAVREDEFDEDDLGKAFGVTTEYAAENFVERNFSSWEYPTELQVWVRKPGETEWSKFVVSVEMIPSFSATEIKDEVPK